ncbi:RAVE protein 1 C terminal-domain-containing protein [Chytriomyces sp. MP71]|nr:RAVE protein 1 C terminal-domain-containing protein [Chytriomyces sp. MP71]
MLITAGESYTLWSVSISTEGELEFDQSWVLPASSPVAIIKFSPDGALFASIGIDDRFLKIWYKTPTSKSVSAVDMMSMYDFLYLPHPCDVTNFEWRKPKRNASIPSTMVKDTGNAILTITKDSTARIWCQTLASFTSHTSFAALEFEMRAAIVPDLGCPTTLHWVQRDAVSEAMEGAMRDGGGSTAKRRKERGGVLSMTEKEYPDMVFGVSLEGGVVLWGIQGLDGVPQRIPKVMVILRTDSGVLPADYDAFMGQVEVMHDVSVIQDSAIYFPPQLNILARSLTGVLNMYTMNLDDFFGSSWTNSYLRLEKSWCGHARTVARFSRHVNRHIVASVSEDGDVNYYVLSCPQVAVRATQGFDLIANVAYPKPTLPGGKILIEWIPNQDIAVVCDGSQVRLEKMSVSSGSVKTLVQLQEAKPRAPITFLRLAHDRSLDTEGRETFLVVGLAAEDHRLYIWKVVLRGDECVSNRLVEADGQLDSSTKIVGAVGLNQFSLVYAPHAMSSALFAGTLDLLGRLTLWSLERVGEIWQLVAAGDVALGSGVLSVQADIFGNLVVVREETTSEWEVSVLRGRVEDNVYTRVWNKVWTSQVVMADIVVSSDGQSLIAVATKSGVDVYCQNRLQTFNSVCEWIQVSEMAVPWDDSVKQITWLPNGSLAVALTTRIAVFSKWKDLSLDSEDATPASLHSVVARINGRLPDYHPDLLMHYLIWSKYDFIKFVLSVVYKFVKLMSENGRWIREIPSAMWKLYAEEDASSASGANYDELFADPGESNTSGEIGTFSQNQLDYLLEMQERIMLPHLSKQDQSRLFAIMSSFVQVEQQKRSIDENGARFVFFARLFIATEKTTDTSALSNRDISWAFYSDSQDFLVDFLNQSFGGKPLWKDARSLGMGYWLRSSDAMKRQIESIARNHYMSKEEKDPVDCALFYICLKKKNVLLGLWKLASSHPEQGAMLKFLANDFAEERWQKAAVKNAFALLGKQRYEYAVAFFLLADRLKDAVNVCLKHLKDLQLAIVLCRLFEGDDSATLIDTLKTNILPDAVNSGDRYLISMCYTLLKQKDMALKATMMPLKSLLDSANASTLTDIIDPPLLVVHNYLQKHYKSMRVVVDPIPFLQQFRFLSASAAIYEDMSCPGLALDILAKAANVAPQLVAESAPTVPPVTAIDSQKETADSCDWGAPVSQNPPSGIMDWGARVAQKSSGNGIDWGTPVSQQASNGGMDWGAPVSQQPASGGMDWGAPVSEQMSSVGMDWNAPESQQVPSGGIDWGDPVPQKPVDEMDEYEAFKKSIMPAEPDELELLEMELEMNDKKNIPVPVEERVSTVEVILDDKQKQMVAKIHNGIQVYQWKMAIRLLHGIHKPLGVVSLNMDILSVDKSFHDYFKLINNGIKNLANQVGMPHPIVDAAITNRFNEMDAFVAFVELPCLVSESAPRTAESFSNLLVEGSNHLSALIFLNSEKSFDTTSVDLIIDFAKRLLWSIIRWYEKEDSGLAPLSVSVMAQTASTAFLALTICYLRSKDYKSLWWIVGLSDRFFEVLVGGAKKKNLKPLILDLLTQREPIIQPESESDDDDLDDDYFGEVSAEKALLAESLLSSIALQHIGLDFQVFVKHFKDGGSADDAYGFLSEVILNKLSSLLFQMHKKVRSSWTGNMKFKISKLGTYLLNKYSQGVWALIKRTANVRKLSALIIAGDNITPSSPEKGIELMSPMGLAATEGEEHPSELAGHVKRTVHYYDESSYEIAFRTKDIVGAFAINPLNSNNFAVATHETIIEFDLDTSLQFHAREEVLSKRRESVDDLAIKSTKKNLKPLLTERLGVSEGENLRRNLSYDSLQKAVKDSMMDLRRRDSELDSGRRIQRDVVSVSSLEAHPTLNYYLAGVGDGNSESIVKLYQFGQKGDLVSYQSGTSARITKCRFDPFGGRFGCTDAKGELRLWKFDATQQSLNPTQVLQCNSAVTNDFAFVNCSTILATAGVSSNGRFDCLTFVSSFPGVTKSSL